MPGKKKRPRVRAFPKQPALDVAFDLGQGAANFWGCGHPGALNCLEVHRIQ